MSRDEATRRALLLYTKPARPGRVKTRLIGALNAEQAAAIHAAFLGDLSERLRGGDFLLRVAWALAEGESFPVDLVAAEVENLRQADGDLGTRLYRGLLSAAEDSPVVAAIGSDHPELLPETAEEAFRRLEAGADVVFGPVPDGGYYLIGLRRQSVQRQLFDGIPWSTGAVLAESLARCHRLGLDADLLPGGHDIDVAEDLRLLAVRLMAGGTACPRTRVLLQRWGWLEEAS